MLIELCTIVRMLNGTRRATASRIPSSELFVPMICPKSLKQRLRRLQTRPETATLDSECASIPGSASRTPTKAVARSSCSRHTKSLLCAMPSYSQTHLNPRERKTLSATSFAALLAALLIASAVSYAANVSGRMEDDMVSASPCLTSATVN